MSVASAGSGQAFDQSERTKTTLPRGMRPCLRSKLRMSLTCRWWLGSRLTCLTIEITTSGRTANVGGSSSMAANSGAQCAGGSSWVPSWSVDSRYEVASKPSFAYV